MTEPTTPPPSPAPAVPVPPAEKKPAPRPGWAPWKSRALRWTTGLLALFALGLVAMWLVQARPLRQQVMALEQERESLQSRLSDAQAEVARLEGVDADNEGLRARNTTLEQQLALLKARGGALRAQFVLASGGDAAEAARALAAADDQLAQLEGALEGPQQESLRSTRYRLAMAAEEIVADPFAAQRDLEVLVNDLESIEAELSGG